MAGRLSPAIGQITLHSSFFILHLSFFILHLSPKKHTTMIYAPVHTPADLLAALPNLLENEQEAADLLDQLQEQCKPRPPHKFGEDIYLDVFEENARTYSSCSEAFRELYDGSIDEFKREKCEDYEACISDFGDYYADWLDSNYTVYYIGKHKILITD